MLTQQVAGTNAQNQVYLTSQVKGSQVLDAAALGAHSKLKYIAFDIVAALFGGLVIGMAIVVVRALISDRLRRRDDISIALGVPVKLSVGAVKKARFSLNPRVRKARKAICAGSPCTCVSRPRARSERILARSPCCSRVDNAKTMVPESYRGWPSPVPRTACGSWSLNLVKGSPLARALGVVAAAARHQVGLKWTGHTSVVVVPEQDDISAPAGPLRPAGTRHRLPRPQARTC